MSPVMSGNLSEAARRDAGEERIRSLEPVAQCDRNHPPVCLAGANAADDEILGQRPNFETKYVNPLLNF